jgi:hypothetical protein
MLAAKDHGAKLPSFGSLADAQSFLFAQRDEVLRALIAERRELDYSPASLLVLEKWHIESGRPANSRDKYSFPVAIGFYFGEILCRHAGFEWIVDEYAFLPGRYEIGVRKKGLSIMLSVGKSPGNQSNKQMKSLWREYSRYAP